MEFVARNRSSEPPQPGQQSLLDPAALVSAQGSAVLRLAPVLPIGRNHLDSVLLFHAPVRRIEIMHRVADQPRRQFVEEARGERFIAGLDSCLHSRFAGLEEPPPLSRDPTQHTSKIAP